MKRGTVLIPDRPAPCRADDDAAATTYLMDKGLWWRFDGGRAPVGPFRSFEGASAKAAAL